MREEFEEAVVEVIWFEEADLLGESMELPEI